MMKRVNIPASKMGKFHGKWVAIDPIKDVIVAVGKTLTDIAPLVVHSIKEKPAKPLSQSPYAFLVPRKDEGPNYILNFA